MIKTSGGRTKGLKTVEYDGVNLKFLKKERPYSHSSLVKISFMHDQKF